MWHGHAFVSDGQQQQVFGATVRKASAGLRRLPKSATVISQRVASRRCICVTS